MEAGSWEFFPGAKHTFEMLDGRPTMQLNGRATITNQTFGNGILEVDVYANQKRSFAGIIFRKQDDTFEEAYMRMHKSRQVDAVQYTPIFHGESNWQLYPEYQANVTFKEEGWNTLRIEVQNNAAAVYVNGEQVLTVDQLRTDLTEGSVGLFALFGNRFSNFRITQKEMTIPVEAPTSSDTDPNIIREWNVSEAAVYDANTLTFYAIANTKRKTVTTEPSGLLPISKHVRKQSSGNFERNREEYVVASTEIDAEAEQVKRFSFDYSDRILVYLNGALIFQGNNAFRAKNNQFQGHLGMTANTLFLNLKPGTNTLHCVVIEKANGWGLMGKLE